MEAIRGWVWIFSGIAHFRKFCHNEEHVVAVKPLYGNNIGNTRF